MHKWLSKLLISCREATRLMSDRTERPLTRRERTRLGLHAFICRMCLRWGKQVESIETILKSYPEAVERHGAPQDPALPTAARERLKAALRREKP